MDVAETCSEVAMLAIIVMATEFDKVLPAVVAV